MYYEPICPRCGLVLINQRSENAYVVELESKKLSFCSGDCRDDYLKDPEGYFGESGCGCGTGCGCH